MTRHTTYFEDLAAALRVWAKGLLSIEAAVELLIRYRLWLYRGDFRETAVEFGSEAFSGRVMAAVGFEAVAGAVQAGELPCASSEGQVLRLAASVAAGCRWIRAAPCRAWTRPMPAWPPTRCCAAGHRDLMGRGAW